MNILDNLKSILFCFHTFGVRRNIDSENQPGSGAPGLTGDVLHQKYDNKKEGFKNYIKYSFHRLKKISLRFMYKAQPRILFWSKPDPHP